MEKRNTFNSMLSSMTYQAGALLSRSRKARDLFMKRAERAAYEYIVEENEDRRPMAVQKEKLRTMLNLMFVLPVRSCKYPRRLQKWREPE